MSITVAPIFAGWNVWDVWQKNDLDFEVMAVGLDRDRRLRVWVEDTADSAPGVKVTDPANPSVTHFNGDEVELLPSTPDALAVKARREDVAGPILTLDGPATLRTVRFYNWGKAGNLAWPHTSNYLLQNVYQPSAQNPVTSAPAPGNVTSTAETGASAAASAIGSSLDTVLFWVAAGVAVGLALKLGRK